VRFHIGFFSNSDEDTTRGHKWVARFKDLEFKTLAVDTVRDGRLVTTITGAIGEYMHQRYDATISSGIDWVYYADTYFPTHTKFSGYSYIATIGAMGDGHKLAELITYMNGNVKRIALLGDSDNRHDPSTYLASYNYLWDDREIGQYKMVRDSVDQMVRVYVGRSETLAIEVPYDSLPSYRKQHMYYGKANYGNWERVYESMGLVGSWTTNPNTTGSSDPNLAILNYNRNARYATVTQGTNARATFPLDANLGDVDVYTYHLATGFDAVINAPITITSEGMLAVPTNVGSGFPVVSITTDTDEFGATDSSKTTIRVDQRRVRSGGAASTTRELAQGSGWIYLGRFRNPTSVVITASASVGTASTQGFVCADAVGIDIGKYGKAAFEMQTRQVRYKTGATDFLDPFEDAGLTIIDLESSSVIDAYGEHTAPAFLDSNITSGARED
jgi:hypothetical protein